MNFDELFDDVYPDLFRYCARMMADRDAAEDVAQEAFVRLLEREVEGDPRGLRAWLYKVATHLIRDGVKLRDNRARLLEKHPVRPEPLDSPSEVVERRERMSRVRRALATLTERERTLLMMREEGFPYRDLAEAIGVQPSSVGTLLARARRGFIEAWDALDPEGTALLELNTLDGKEE